MQDVRFLRDVGRISSPVHPALVRSINDFYCSLVVFRTDSEQAEETMEDIRRHLRTKKDYKYSLGRCMDFVRGVAPCILAAEAEQPQQTASPAAGDRVQLIAQH